MRHGPIVGPESHHRHEVCVGDHGPEHPVLPVAEDPALRPPDDGATYAQRHPTTHALTKELGWRSRRGNEQEQEQCTQALSV